MGCQTKPKISPARLLSNIFDSFTRILCYKGLSLNDLTDKKGRKPEASCSKNRFIQSASRMPHNILNIKFLPPIIIVIDRLQFLKILRIKNKYKGKVWNL